MSVITTPITASKIKEVYAYYTGNISVFSLNEYAGLSVVYPDGFKDYQGNPILDANGEQIYVRVLPTDNSIKFSDFLGSVGYFLRYVAPSITVTQQIGTVSGNSNTGETTHTVKLSINDRNNENPPWRPDVTRVVTAVQWQRSIDESQWSDFGAVQTYDNIRNITSTITEANGDQGKVYWRVSVTADAYAPNDDEFPAAGQLGDSIIRSTGTLTSNTGQTTLTPYQPTEPKISTRQHRWSKQSAGGAGDYVVEVREIDQVILAKPSPVLSFTGGDVAYAEFDSAPGRSATTSLNIEWQFKNLQDVAQTDWLPIEQLTFDYDNSPYDDDDFNIATNNQGLSIGPMSDGRYDGFKFRAKITATQTLSAPAATNQLIAYTDSYPISVSDLTRSPEYSLTGSSAVVNGGTFSFNFDANYVGTRDYYYLISEPMGQDDFINENGTLSIVADGDADFTITTYLDGDTDNETFLLEVFDTATDQRVATKNISIVYGSPRYYIATNNITLTEGGSFELDLRAENVGDQTVYYAYNRTVADDTTDDDFKYGETLIPAETRQAVSLTVDPDLSDNTVIVSRARITLTSINDSFLGGEAGNFERFEFHIYSTPTSSSQDNVTVTVNDELNYQIDLFGSQPTSLLEYDVVRTYSTATYTPSTASLSWLNSGGPLYHVSWADITPGHVEYRWQVRTASSSSWTPIGEWQDVEHSESYTLWTSSQGQIKSYGPDSLVFEDFETTSINIAGLSLTDVSDLRWRVAMRAVGSTGIQTEVKYTGYWTMRIVEKSTYVNTGIYGVTVPSPTEGAGYPDWNVRPIIRSKGMIGQQVTVTISDPNFTALLIDFQKSSPLRPGYTPPTDQVTVTITWDVQEVDLGTWFYHSRGYSDADAQLAVAATAITGYTDTGYASQSNTWTVRDQRPELYAVLDSATVKPGDTLGITMMGTNISGSTLGYSIEAPRGVNPLHWFTLAGQTGYSATFDDPGVNSNDYYTRGHAKKQGKYVTDKIDISVNDHMPGEYFTPITFYAETRNSVYTSPGVAITLTSGVPKPAVYSVNLRAATSPLKTNESFSIIAEIDGEQPNDLTHTWEIEYLVFGPESSRFTEESGTIRLGYPSDGSDKILITPQTNQSGQFTLTVTDSSGVQRGKETFSVQGIPPVSVSVNNIIDNIYASAGGGLITVNLPDLFGGGSFQIPDLRGVGEDGPLFPTGSSIATASGGSGVYTDYAWSVSITEGNLLSYQADGNKLIVAGQNERVTGTISCTVTDNQGNQATGTGTLKFNHNRPSPPLPALTATINDTIDARTIIEYNGGDDGYATDSVTVNVAGGSGNYSYAWSFAQRNITRVTLSGSGETAATVTGVIVGNTGLNSFPPGTVGSASGTVTCVVTDTQTNKTVSVSCGVYLSITVRDQTAGGDNAFVGGTAGGGFKNATDGILIDLK